MKTRGQALVEMAIVLLLLLLLVFGIIQFGWLMYIKNTLNNAARAGARMAVVTTPWNTMQVNAIKAYTASSATYVTVSSGNVNVCVNDTTCDTDNSSSNSPQTGDSITVKVTSPPITAFTRLLSFATPSSLYGRASMRYE